VVLASVAGSGPHGAVLASDVEALVAAPTSAAGATGPSRIWMRMAERVTESWQTAPHFFLTREVDASELERRRTLAHQGGATSVTATDLLLKICAGALREHPQVNACWHDGVAVRAEDVNIGIAVAVDDGLVVPVVRGVDRLELEAVATRRADLVAAAREGRLRPDDVEAGTFTISNLGMYGVDGFFAIVNPPQVAILAVGRIAERVVAVEGAPAVRPTLVLGLSFDHRAVDGARGAQFLDSLARLIGDPAGVVP
jgi:pyruvate dehydrogenase E2 component (dihydrolipoamide acetyltransferase)